MMFLRILDWLVHYAERRAIKRIGGIPLMWIIYKPDKDPPNVIYNFHPDIEQGPLKEQLQKTADMVREQWEVR